MYIHWQLLEFDKIMIWVTLTNKIIKVRITKSEKKKEAKTRKWESRERQREHGSSKDYDLSTNQYPVE